MKSGIINYRIMRRYGQKDGWIELVAIWKKVLTKSHQKHVHIYDNINKYLGSYKAGRIWINKHNDIRTLLIAIALTVLFC